MKKITKDSNLGEVLTKYPKVAEVLIKKGFHCLGCIAANFETIEQAAQVHGLDVKKLVSEMNKTIKKK